MQKSEMKRVFVDAINQYRRKIYALDSLPIDIFQGAFPEGKWVAATYSIDFFLPYEFGLIQMVRNFLKAGEYKVSYDHAWISAETAYQVLTVKIDKKIAFDITFKSSYEGSTCVLNKIGEKEVTEMKPIYEVICSKGAAENAL